MAPRLTQTQPSGPSKVMPCRTPVNPGPSPVKIKLDAVGVLHPRVPTERVVAERVVVGKLGGAFDFDGAGQFRAVAPLGDVDVVNAPPGHVAERVIADVEPVRIDEPRGRVGRPGGGAEPEIVVEPIGDRFGRVGLQARALGGARRARRP